MSPKEKKRKMMMMMMMMMMMKMMKQKETFHNQCRQTFFKFEKKESDKRDLFLGNYNF